jgi:hypothetical protein
MGDDCQLYYSATLGGSGSLTAIDAVIDDEISSERRTADSNARGDSEIKVLVGKPKHSLTGNMQVRVGSPATAYLAMKSAYYSKTVLHFAAATGDITHIGQQVFRFEGEITKWTESRPDGGQVQVAFEIMPTAASTYASSVSVVAS